MQMAAEIAGTARRKSWSMADKLSFFRKFETSAWDAEIPTRMLIKNCHIFDEMVFVILDALYQVLE